MTYTDFFSGPERKPPRYDYNQLMFGLDLDEPRPTDSTDSPEPSEPTTPLPGGSPRSTSQGADDAGYGCGTPVPDWGLGVFARRR